MLDTFREVFQTLHDYNFSRGLAIHTKFDDLDLISRTQVGQNYKLRIVFRFLFPVITGVWSQHTLKRYTVCFV